MAMSLCYFWMCVFAVWCCVPGNCQFQCYDGSFSECGGSVISSVNSPTECCLGPGYWFRTADSPECKECASPGVCNENEFNLVFSFDTGRQQVIQDILDILSTIFLANNNPLPDNEFELLDALYNSLAHGFERAISGRGYNQFIEAVNEISVFVASANTVEELNISNVPELVREFRSDLNDRSHNKYQKLRSLYGKLLRIRNSLGEDSSRRRRQTSCECPEGGLNGQIFHPCQFFDCLNPRDIEPIFGFTEFECLAFVLDTTGSMKDEIKFAAEIIKSFMGSERELNELGCYMFVPFNDVGPDNAFVAENSVGPIHIVYPENISASVDSLMDFVESIEKSFQPDSGGDCPEYAYDGLLQALEYEEEDFLGNKFQLMYPGSQVIALTDAPSKKMNTNMTQNIIDTAEDTGVCIHFFLGLTTFNCFEEVPNSVKDYRNIAQETGGIVIDNLMDFSSFVSSYKDTPCRHVEQELVRHRRSAENKPLERCKTFQVSALASVLKLIASLSSSYDSETTITWPDNSSIKVAVIDGSQTTDRIVIFSTVHPMPGEWMVCVEHGTLEVSVQVTSLINIVALYSVLHPHNNVSLSASPIPPPACTIGEVLLLSSQYKDILNATLNLVDDAGINAHQFRLRKCSGLLTGIGTFPSGDFTFHVEGVDNNGNSFLAKTKREATFLSGNIFYNFTCNKQTSEIKIDQLFDITFTLSSTNPYGGMMFDFTVDDVEHFSEIVNPTNGVVYSGGSIEVTVSAVVTSHDVSEGSSHIFTVTASNPCISLTASCTVTVKSPPPTVPPSPPSENICGCENGGTCLVILRRGRQLLRCNCLDGFRGRRCERAV